MRVQFYSIVQRCSSILDLHSKAWGSQIVSQVIKQLYLYNSFETMHVIRGIDLKLHSGALGSKIASQVTSNNWCSQFFETMHVIRDESSLWTPPRWLAYSLRATMRGGSRNFSSPPACQIEHPDKRTSLVKQRSFAPLRCLRVSRRGHYGKA